MEFDFKQSYNFNDLVKITQLLRSPNGCPWDKVQTHSSVRQNFIEETYEVIEAIDTDDVELLKEELGDVLLQVVFHAEMENEKSTFDIHDVCDGICKKLILRHPHIFSNVKVNSAEDVLKNWDTIKMKTKSQNTQTQSMQSVSKALPSLMRSSKIQQKAAKVGFDWDNVNGALQKIHEEIFELEEAIKNDIPKEKEEELGDLLFSVVNVSRFINVDSEKALYNACDKFVNRFSAVEALAKERNILMQSASLDELNSLWDEVKKMDY